MKYLSILTCGVILTIGCSPTDSSGKQNNEKHSNLEVIAIIGNFWDREYSAVIFYDSTMFQKTVLYNKIYQHKSEVDEFVSVKNSISKPAFECLEEYMESNCNELFPSKADFEEAHNFYTIKLIQENKTKECYYYAKDLNMVIEYFVGMKNWIERSKYKDEFTATLSYINGNINGLNRLK